MDRVINSILDGLLEATGIDPAWMEPDHKLRADLSMTQSEVEAFVRRLVKDMELPLDVPIEMGPDLSLRQLCDQIKAAMPKERVVA